MRIALLYAFFAAVATAVNIGSQALTWRALSPVIDADWALVWSVLVGTAVGLAVKYGLDKRWIFAWQAKSGLSEARSLVLYTVFGGAMTIVFWAFEFGAEHFIGGEVARYSGAVVGLAIGYAAKYLLDKHVTFHRRHAKPADELGERSTQQ